jgi:glucan phosphoethanolaminetransferase (alkaline phosphatase superfamily)
MVKKITSYTVELIIDVIMGITLGVIVNTLTNFIGEYFKLNHALKLLVQICLIIAVLYLMKRNSKYLPECWKGEYDYGILFTSSFIISQKNLIVFIDKFYVDIGPTLSGPKIY